MQVPQFQLAEAVERVREEVERRWEDVLGKTAFVGGAEVGTFETAFAEYLGAAGCVGVGNGTDALVVALRALDLQPGDEVIVPAFSFFATAISQSLSPPEIAGETVETDQHVPRV